MDSFENVSDQPGGGAVRVSAQRVEESRREGTLARHFGAQLLRFEYMTYTFMRRFATDYDGGLWEFVELSNGGFYMRPQTGPFAFRVETNGYDGTLSADAAGITVCLFTYSHLSFQDGGGELFGEHFHRLREFAMEHLEAGQIFAAID